MKSIFTKIMILSLIFSLFTGCALIKAQKSNASDKAWNELFDNKSWEPVNKESGKKKIL